MSELYHSFYDYVCLKVVGSAHSLFSTTLLWPWDLSRLVPIFLYNTCFDPLLAQSGLYNSFSTLLFYIVKSSIFLLHYDQQNWHLTNANSADLINSQSYLYHLRNQTWHLKIHLPRYQVVTYITHANIMHERGWLCVLILILYLNMQ